ncbi:MAG: phosphoglycerate dehydrogenase [Chloroflexota bacterium]|nr:phosphoglycerate dehydrogenase [Chloroflexota bacterium]
MSHHFKILVADPLAKEGVAALSAYAEVDVKTGMTKDEIKDIIGEYDAIAVRSETKVTAEIIEAGKKLQVIGRAGVGVDNIDLEAATQNGIMVVNAPTGNTISAAEHTIALMMALARHIPQAHQKLKGGEWKRKDYMGMELRNKTLGVVGLGNVGSEVSKRAIGLAMRVIAHDPFVSVEFAANLGVKMVSLDELLKESDFITLHTPLSSDTKGLIGEKELAKLKTGVRIINCARGGIIDEELLFKAVEEGKIAGAAVDVFTKEPATENVLFGSDKIIVTPHLAASTTEAQILASTDVAEEIIAVLKGDPVRYAVNIPRIPASTLAIIGPFLGIAKLMGKLLHQLGEGQMQSINIKYEGEIAGCDTSALKANIIGGLIEGTVEERVNLVNANMIAQRRGLKITETTDPTCEVYANMITIEMITTTGKFTVAGTTIRSEPHIARINDFWIDIVPREGYFLVSDHRDRPGLIGSVGTILGNADINISAMHLGRLELRGNALLILDIDEAVNDKVLQELRALPEVYSMKLVKL